MRTRTKYLRQKNTGGDQVKFGMRKFESSSELGGCQVLTPGAAGIELKNFPIVA